MIQTLRLLLLFILPAKLGLLGIILSFGIPKIIIFNWGPVFPAARSLNISPFNLIQYSSLPILFTYGIITILLVLFTF